VSPSGVLPRLSNNANACSSLHFRQRTFREFRLTLILITDRLFVKVKSKLFGLAEISVGLSATTPSISIICPIAKEVIMLPNPAGGKYGPTSGSPNLYPPGTEHLRPDNVEWPPKDPVVKKAETEAASSVGSLPSSFFPSLHHSPAPK
jgi:hypothetical protein